MNPLLRKEVRINRQSEGSSSMTRIFCMLRLCLSNDQSKIRQSWQNFYQRPIKYPG
jgi:hypothetical protein